MNPWNVSSGLLKKLETAPFRAIDRQFALYLISRYDADDSTALAGAVTSALLESGHSCLFFDDQCEKLWGDESTETFQLPEADEWIKTLQNSPAVGKAGERKPLILDGRRLYIYKYFNFEKRVSDRLHLMVGVGKEKVSESVLELAKKLFKEEKDLSLYGGQLQTAGAFLPFFSHLSIISGGPGTGKTTVVAKLLALLCADSMEKGGSFPAIALAAPTGKAAQRMGESIRKAADMIPDQKMKDYLSKLIPSTLHRLLGIYGSSPKPKRNSQSPIDADLVVVDEASMMDITLFTRLIDALPQESRLVLLGDRYQLASVDAGSVMADICNAYSPNTFTQEFAGIVNGVIADPKNHLPASPSVSMLSPLVELQYSYRFEGGKPIGIVSSLMNSGLAEQSLSALTANQSSDHYCRLSDYPGDAALAAVLLEGYGKLFNAQTPEEALTRVGDFMVLTALNESRFGREGINKLVYRSYGSVPPVRPIKITENSPQHRLFNGDIGVIRRTKNSDGKMIEHAWFPAVSDDESESSDKKRTVRSFLVGMLPSFVDAFAITIHNSQGSEFEKVITILPERDTQLLTRELLYTAVTRAKTQLQIYGSSDIITQAIKRKTLRHSGLEDRIKNSHCDVSAIPTSSIKSEKADKSAAKRKRKDKKGG
jgi:exodeoxyribonuclease V alpha subunit